MRLKSILMCLMVTVAFASPAFAKKKKKKKTDVGNQTQACLTAQKVSIWLWPNQERVRGCDPNLVEITSLIILEAGKANKKMSYVPLPSVTGGTIRGAVVGYTVAKAAARYSLKAAGYTLAWVKYLGSGVVVKATNKLLNNQENSESVRSHLAHRYRTCYVAVRQGTYDAGYRKDCVGAAAKRWLPTK